MKKGTDVLLSMLTILFSKMVYAITSLVSSVHELNQLQPNLQAGDVKLFSEKSITGKICRCNKNTTLLEKILGLALIVEPNEIQDQQTIFS